MLYYCHLTRQFSVCSTEFVQLSYGLVAIGDSETLAVGSSWSSLERITVPSAEKKKLLFTEAVCKVVSLQLQYVLKPRHLYLFQNWSNNSGTLPFGHPVNTAN